MKANSGLKKNRTKIQMVLTALVILSVVRQFFLGNYHNMFLGILTLSCNRYCVTSRRNYEKATGSNHASLPLLPG